VAELLDRSLGEVHRNQAHQNGEVRYGIDAKTYGRPRRRDEKSCDCRSPDPRQIERYRIQSDGFSDLAPPDHEYGHRLTRRQIKRVYYALKEGKSCNIGEVDDIQNGQRRQSDRLRHGKKLGRDEQFTPVVIVGDHAAEGRQEENRQLTAKGNEPQEERGVRQIVDQPALGDQGNPRPNKRNQLA